jgi:20S proteasome subunit alpha 2
VSGGAGADEEPKPSGKTGGILKGGPMLYQVDPSGSYYPWKATAIGKSATSAKTFLEKRYTEGLELEDAVHIALLTLKETIEGEMNGETVEIGMSPLWIDEDEFANVMYRYHWTASTPPYGC